MEDLFLHFPDCSFGTVALIISLRYRLSWDCKPGTVDRVQHHNKRQFWLMDYGLAFSKSHVSINIPSTSAALNHATIPLSYVQF